MIAWMEPAHQPDHARRERSRTLAAFLSRRPGPADDVDGGERGHLLPDQRHDASCSIRTNWRRRRTCRTISSCPSLGASPESRLRTTCGRRGRWTRCFNRRARRRREDREAGAGRVLGRIQRLFFGSRRAPVGGGVGGVSDLRGWVAGDPCDGVLRRRADRAPHAPPLRLRRARWRGASVTHDIGRRARRHHWYPVHPARRITHA